MHSDDARTSAQRTAREQVMRYVVALEAELAGCDPALRHDAVIDAETHLRSAIDAGVPVERAIAEFGTPQEIARAYREQDGDDYGWRPVGDGPSRAVPSASRPSLASRIPIFGIWIDPRAWGALVYFGGVGFVLSTAYFVWSVTLGSLVVGLLPVIAGLPVLVLLLGSARGICLFEGKVVEALLGVRMPRRVQPVEGAGSVGFWQRMLCWFRDVRSWMSLAYLLGNFFISVGIFAITITMCALSVSMVLAPVLALLGVPAITMQGDGPDPITIRLLWWTLEPDADGVLHLPAGASIAMTVVGVCLATATLWLVRGLGWIYGHVVQAIQVARPQAAGRLTTNSPYGTHP